jgi:hypothetical protein
MFLVALEEAGLTRPPGRSVFNSLGGVAGHDLISVSQSTISPFGFSFPTASALAER